MSQRLTSKSETGAFPSDGGASVAEIVLKVAGDKGGPAIVLFVNDAPYQDPRIPEGKATQVPIRDTLSMRPCLLNPRIEPFCMALRLFRIITVDVQGVDPSACAAVNKYKAPFVAVTGLDGKAVKVFGPGISTKTQIQAAMTTALKPKLSLDEYCEKENKLVQLLVKYDSLGATLKARQDALTNPASSVSETLAKSLQRDIDRYQAEIDAMGKDVSAMEAKIDEYLSKKGMSRVG